jgi:hypothetical protein
MTTPQVRLSAGSAAPEARSAYGAAAIATASKHPPDGQGARLVQAKHAPQGFTDALRSITSTAAPLNGRRALYLPVSCHTTVGGSGREACESRAACLNRPLAAARPLPSSS